MYQIKRKYRRSKLNVCRIALVGIIGCAAQAASAGIVQVDYASLSGIAGSNFEDLGLANNATVNYPGIFESGNTSFGGSFAGQTVTASGNFDVLSGTPTGPLTLVSGGALTNVSAVDGGAGDVGNTSIAGVGPLGYPNYDAIGEGSIAILFDYGQSEFGFDIVGANGGSADLQFWDVNGSLIDQVTLSLGSDVFTPIGFKTDDGAYTIAGVSIFNDDPGGIGFDNFIYNVAGVPGTPNSGGTSIPEPSTFALLGLGLLGTLASRRKKSNA